MTEIQVTVDDQLCAASALCAAYRAVHLRSIGRRGLGDRPAPTITDGEQIALAREAMSNCPTGRS